MSQTDSTAAIILAAGSSSRMGGGRHKLLLPLDDRPVLAHVIDAALASQARPILVVLGHQASEVRMRMATYTAHPDIIFVENPNYLAGMSTSMRVGLQALVSYGYRKAEGYSEKGQLTAPEGVASPYPGEAINRVPPNVVDSGLIMLGDQPLITPRIIDRLIEAWQKTNKRVVAPLYDGKRGGPVLFAASLFPELMEVSGDEGGRSVVERHRQELEAVELGETIANFDVDTWEAYQEVVEAWQRKKTRETES